jgi:hypothetical protein
MAPRAERRVGGAPKAPREPRFEIDRSWLLRAAVALVVFMALLLVVKVSIMAFGGGNRMERLEQRSEDTVPPKTGTGAASPQR